MDELEQWISSQAGPISDSDDHESLSSDLEVDATVPVHVVEDSPVKVLVRLISVYNLSLYNKYLSF